MSSNGESAFSSADETSFEMVSRSTFKWAVPEIKKGLSGLTHEEFVGGNGEDGLLPRMTWSFSLRTDWKDDFANRRFINVAQFRYECNVNGGEPPPMHEVTVSALGSNNNRDSDFYGRRRYRDKELYKSGLRNNIYGFFDLGEYPSPLDGIPLIDNVLVFEITLEFYRPLEAALKGGPVDAWNKKHERTGKIHFLEMLKTGQFSDVKIRSSDGQEFYAHKLILKAGSEVFEAMFRNDMTESRSGVIILNDISAKAVEFLLHFIYSSELLPISFDEDDEAAGENVSIEDVVYLASKYGFAELITFLDEGMKSFCTENNALRLLKLCENYSLEKGKEDVFEFLMTDHADLLKNFVLTTLQKE